MYSMIQGYTYYGFGKESLKLFIDMIKSGVQPNFITFISLLNGCSHCNLVNEALYYFDFMKNKYEIKPTLDHENCIVDALGRFKKK